MRLLLDETFPGLPHAAALIGSGSEILGFDDEMSTNRHHYGPRPYFSWPMTQTRRLPDAIRQMLADRLPYRCQYPSPALLYGAQPG